MLLSNVSTIDQMTQSHVVPFLFNLHITFGRHVFTPFSKSIFELNFPSRFSNSIFFVFYTTFESNVLSPKWLSIEKSTIISNQKETIQALKIQVRCLTKEMIEMENTIKESFILDDRNQRIQCRDPYLDNAFLPPSKIKLVQVKSWMHSQIGWNHCSGKILWVMLIWAILWRRSSISFYAHIDLAWPQVAKL